MPIEDIGVAGAPYAMTRDDLLAGNRDLIAHCIALLSQQPASRLAAQLDQSTLTVTVAASGLTCLDALFDGHPGSSTPVSGDAAVMVTYPSGTKLVDLIGWSGDTVRQRRRLPTT